MRQLLRRRLVFFNSSIHVNCGLSGLPKNELATRDFVFVRCASSSSSSASPSRSSSSFSPSVSAPTATPLHKSFYKRHLPVEEDKLISFSSDEGRRLLAQCISDLGNEKGGGDTYFPLAEQFLTQSSPPSCATASLAMVLNSLKVDPGRIWQGGWRWYTEEMLSTRHVREIEGKEGIYSMHAPTHSRPRCSKHHEHQAGGRKPLVKELVRNRPVGLSLHELAFLAECNRAVAQTFEAHRTSLAFFRFALRECTRKGDGDDSPRMVVSFSRKALGQTGEGHFSPVAAFHASSDMVLVMDVARFKYPPYWVKVDLLFEAMQKLDPDTGRSRGFLIISCLDGAADLCRQPNEEQQVQKNGEDTMKEAMKEVQALSVQCEQEPEVALAMLLEEVHEHDEEVQTKMTQLQFRRLCASYVHSLRWGLCVDRENTEARLQAAGEGSGELLLEKIRGVIGSVDGLLNGEHEEGPNLLYMLLLQSRARLRPLDMFLRSIPQYAPHAVCMFLQELQRGDLCESHILSEEAKSMPTLKNASRSNAH